MRYLIIILSCLLFTGCLADSTAILTSEAQIGSQGMSKFYGYKNGDKIFLLLKAKEGNITYWELEEMRKILNQEGE